MNFRAAAMLAGLLGLALALAGASPAPCPGQSNRPSGRPGTPPVGIFISRGPGPAIDREVNFPFLEGWLARPGWNTVEPEEGRYDWSLIEADIATARRLGKKITLAILGGPQTPQWVYQDGARKVEYTITSRSEPGRKGTIPPLWDEVYLQKWTTLIRALGKRFAGEETIALIHITGATDNGLEMHLPFSSAARKQWRKLDSTPEKVIAAWKRILDAYGEAFPQTPLDIDVHPVLGSDQVAEEIAAYGYEKFGKRFGIFGGWLSGKSARQDPHHAGMHPIVEKYGKLSFVGFQMIGNQTRQPDRFASGDIRTAFAQGMDWGARYFEVWRADVLNPQMHPLLNEVARKLRR